LGILHQDLRTTPTVSQKDLLSLFFWQKKKKEAPTIWQKGLASLASLKAQV
jgi:hypothetical protein